MIWIELIQCKVSSCVENSGYYHGWIFSQNFWRKIGVFSPFLFKTPVFIHINNHPIFRENIQPCLLWALWEPLQVNRIKTEILINMSIISTEYSCRVQSVCPSVHDKTYITTGIGNKIDNNELPNKEKKNQESTDLVSHDLYKELCSPRWADEIMEWWRNCLLHMGALNE